MKRGGKTKMKQLLIFILAGWFISINGVSSFAAINQHKNAIINQSPNQLHGIIVAEKEISGQVTEIKNGNMYIQGLLKERGIQTLAENAFNLFSDGLTSIEEFYPLLFNY